MKIIYLFDDDRIANLFLSYANLKFDNTIKSNSIVVLKKNKINDYILNILLEDLKKNFTFFKSNFFYKLFKKFPNIKYFYKVIPLLSLRSDHFHINIKKIINDLSFIDFFQNQDFLNKYYNLISKNNYLCFSFRDANYLSQISNKDFSYHSYRDFDPKNLIDALEEASMKYDFYCFRIGKFVNSSIKSNKRIIDFANLYQNDIDDINLLKKCFLNICDSSGIIYLGLINFKNTLRINCNLNDLNKPFNNTLSLIVKYKDMLTNKIITYEEAIKRGVMKFKSSKEFLDNNLVIIPNSKEEILDTIIFLLKNDIYTNNIDQIKFDFSLNIKLNDLISSYIDNKNNDYLARYDASYKSKISPVFLKKNTKLIC